MRQRPLGAGGPLVSAIGLGCMGLVDGYYGPVTDQQARAAVGQALDLGVTLFDTADSYGAGAGELRLGGALAGRRDEVLISTKFGLVTGGAAAGRAVDGRPQNVRASAQGSLRRLGTDVIDLYQLHRVDPDVPIEETVGAMAELVTAGQVRYLGVSEASSEQVRRAAAVHPMASVQSEYSLFERGVESGVLAACGELGASLLAFAPLGKGLLTGSLQRVHAFAGADLRSRLPRFGGEHLSENQRLVGALAELAARHGVSTGQLALAWLLARSPVVLPIPGSVNGQHLAENVAAADLELPPETLSLIETVIGAGAVSGERYPPGWRLPQG